MPLTVHNIESTGDIKRRNDSGAKVSAEVYAFLKEVSDMYYYLINLV